jgi:general secretion pathway protein N
VKAAALTLAFVAALLVALVALAPSTLLDDRLSIATQGRLRLASARGTLWHGTAMLTDAAGTWSIPVDWRVQPSPAALSAALVLEPPPNRTQPRGRVELRDGTLHLDGISLAVPAAALDGLFAAPGAWALGGNLILDASSFEWNGTRGSGALNLRWRGARIAGSGSVLELGTVALDLAPHEDRLRGRLTNDGGDVRIAGDVEVSGAGANVDATLTPAPSAAREIVRALGTLGAADASGAVRVQWRGAPRQELSR